jgi:hypothetical protein
MPIKKSTLEQKWYYRIAKTLFLILPFIVIIFFLLSKKTIVCDILPVNIFDILWQNIGYIIIWLILYFLILTALWRIFLYIAFGGMEDDTQKKESGQTQSANQPEPKSVKIVRLIAIIIILFAFAILLLSKMGYITPSGINTDLSGQDTKLTPASGYTCPATSAQTSTPCHSAKGGVGVSGVIVPDKCNCPSDTKYAQMDNITAGGPYKICTCK